MAGVLFMMLAIAEEEDRRMIPRPIRLHNSNLSSAFNLTDEEFARNFRLNKRLVNELIERLRPFIQPRTLRKSALTTEMKVLCALNFFAHGCYQRKVGSDIHIRVSQSTVSKCIREVSTAISRNLLHEFVKFPEDVGSQMAIKDGFYNYCGIGGILGAIDCTHVAIIAPPDDGFHNERNYINRKGWHSVNVQLVCDMNMLILNVVARFPGCTHDSYIWQSSLLKRAFSSGTKIHGEGWLIGDSGYAQEMHLHTPYTESTARRIGQTAMDYNAAHSKGRCIIERCNGVIKNRFRCLLKHRVLHYMPEIAGKIINSCVILHNMCILENLEWAEVDLPDEDQLFDTY